MTKKPKVVDEWNIPDKYKKKVKDEMNKWVEHFTFLADGKTANVRKLDYINDDVLFYTDCKDILLNNPESKHKEKNKKILKRKHNVSRALLLDTITNNKKAKQLKCTHCGSSDYYFISLDESTFEYCYNCDRMILDTYLPFYKEEVWKAYFEMMKIWREHDKETIDYRD
jgi:hypothetical protein